MKKEKLQVILATILIIPLLAYSQNNSIDKIIDNYKKNYLTPGSDLNQKIVDLDNDNDLDYIFSFSCGEGNCLRVFINENGSFKKVIDEFGIVSFDLSNSQRNSPSKIILKSKTNHCCGESPYGSFREFYFNNNQMYVKSNYVIYNYDSYNNEDNYRLIINPWKILDQAYDITILFDNYNVRFSADLDSHNSTFTCPDQTNIIAKLKKNSTVKVIAEHKGNDHEQRTWLYVEIPNSAIQENSCPPPLTYEFENQKLRGWISNKSVRKK